jgi:hypothetical protein
MSTIGGLCWNEKAIRSDSEEGFRRLVQASDKKEFGDSKACDLLS